MRAAPRTGVTALVLGMLAGSAGAEMAIYYHVGSWDAFSGPGADGKPICGIGSTNPVDGRSFSIRFAIGSDSVQFQAKKPNWSIPANTQLPTVMQIGLDTPWNLQGVGNGQIVEWSLDRTTIQAFDAQFRRAGSMTLTFPSGSEPPWTVGLKGSTAISNAFGRCISTLSAQTATAAPVPVGPTQPFSQAPAQPITQEPIQPITPR